MDKKKRRFDVGRLIRRMDGDKELVTQITNIFLDELPDLLRRGHLAIKERDSGELVRVAHSLAGSVGNFDDKDILTECRDLEHMARTNFKEARKSFPRIEQYILGLSSELRKIV